MCGLSDKSSVLEGSRSCPNFINDFISSIKRRINQSNHQHTHPRVLSINHTMGSSNSTLSPELASQGYIVPGSESPSCGPIHRASEKEIPHEGAYGPSIDTLFKLFQRSVEKNPAADCMGTRADANSPFVYSPFQQCLVGR